MTRNTYWKTSVRAGGATTVINAFGIFFARGVFGLAGFAVMSIICLSWVLQTLLENKQLRQANLLASILLVVYGTGVLGFRFAGFLQNMSVVGLSCACLDLLVGLLVLVQTVTLSNV